MRLTGIITQGASRLGTAEFIKAFKVAYSFDGKGYVFHQNDKQKKDRVSRGGETFQFPVFLKHSYFLCYLHSAPIPADLQWEYRQWKHQDEPLWPPSCGPVFTHHPCSMPQSMHPAHGADWLRAQWYSTLIMKKPFCFHRGLMTSTGHS